MNYLKVWIKVVFCKLPLNARRFLWWSPSFHWYLLHCLTMSRPCGPRESSITTLTRTSAPRTRPSSKPSWSSWKRSWRAASSSKATKVAAALTSTFTKVKQGNYSLRRPPKLTIPQAVIGQRWATVNSNLYKQTCMYVCMYDPYTNTHTIIWVTDKKRDHLAPRFATSV